MNVEDFPTTAHCDALLALPTQVEQLRWLDAQQRLNQEGIDALLTRATDALREDPARGHALGLLGEAAAQRISAPALRARARYLLAQSHAIRAEFDRALALIDAARDEYSRLGLHAEALRTEIGRIAALSELGRHTEAIEIAERALVSARHTAIDPELVARFYLNLGLAYVEVGRADAGLSALDAAEHAYTNADAPHGAALVGNNRGLLLLSLGRAREALAAFETCERQFLAEDDPLEAAHAVQNAGYACLLLGDHGAGLRALQRAGTQLKALGATADEFVARLDLADAYAGLNLHPEAVSAYREAGALLGGAGMARERARALWGLGSSQSALAYFSDAERSLASAAALFRDAGNQPALASVLLDEAALAHARGDGRVAVARAEEALVLADASGMPLQATSARLRLSHWLDGIDNARAAGFRNAAQTQADQLGLPQLRQAALTETGFAALRDGAADIAQQAFGSAIALAERQRNRLGQTRARSAFVADKTRAYKGLVLAYLAQGDANRAFDTSERARARTLTELMRGVASARVTSGDSDLTQDNATQLRALQVSLNDCYAALFDDDAGGPGANRGKLQAKALELEQDIARLQLESAGFDAAPERRIAPLTRAEISAALEPGAILISYFAAEGELLAFVLRAGSAETLCVKLGALGVVHGLQTRLARQFEHVAQDPEFAARRMTQLERGAREVLRQLFDLLVQPIELALGRLPAETPVLIVPHGPLHQTPFHALHDGDAYWCERAGVSTAPSATALALCQGQLRAPQPGGAFVLGVADARVPEVVDEARAVAAQLPDAVLRLNDDATRARVLTEANGCATLHLACHGLFRSDNPMFSALKLGDGWLTADEIATLNLQGAQVVLSACESGRSGEQAGDELLGLSYAFLGAGARTLLASQWLVHDASTAAFMSVYYAGLNAGHTPVEALRAAQLEIKRRWMHPFYWAPFVLIGGR
jgi:CHAT domain-containing protein